MQEHYNLMVIGGGTAGLRTALKAASQGTNTVLIEPGVLGGTCLNTGCIPTKAMLHASHLFSRAKNLKEYGVEVTKVHINLPKMMQRVHSFIEDGHVHIKKSLKKNTNLTLVKEKASFINENTVVAGKKEISADKIIICTGAKNVILPIKGLDTVTYLDNVSVVNLKKLPKSIIMIGGGYISMEFATFFAEMGCKVTILERLPRVLAMLDEDVTSLLEETYSGKGVSIKTNTNIIEIKKEKKGVSILYNDVRNPKSKKITIKAEKILLAVGRAPNTDGLSLDKANIKLGERKNIEVNEFLQTSNPNVYAIGDVNGKAMFAHTAKRESRIAIENSIGNKNSTMNFDLVPWAVFTTPAVGGVGITEKTATDKKLNFGVMKADFSDTGRAAIMGETDGFVKVIYDKGTRQILGCTIIGPDADDLIHEFVAVMNAKATIDTIKETIHIHPTLAEVMEELSDE